MEAALGDRLRRQSKRSSRNAQGHSRRDQQPGGEVQEGSLAASSKTAVRSQGKLWKRVQGTTFGAARDFTIVFGSVICFHSFCCSFILVSDVFPPGTSSLRGKWRARDSLVEWCRPSRRNLGNKSAFAQGKYRSSRLNASSQRHLDQAIVRKVYRVGSGKCLKSDSACRHVGFQQVQEVFGQ